MKKNILPVVLTLAFLTIGSILPVYAAEAEQVPPEFIVIKPEVGKELSTNFLTLALDGSAMKTAKEEIIAQEKAKADAEKAAQAAKLKAAQAAKEKAAKEAQIKAEQEAQAKAAQEAQAKAEQEAQAQAEQEAAAAQTQQENSQPSGRTLIMEATAYSCNEGGIGGGYVTALGQDLTQNPMAVAVDPSVIPLGTRVYVEGYGEAIASDTGGAIQGNIIDVHFADPSMLDAWGRRQVTVTILD